MKVTVNVNSKNNIWNAKTIQNIIKKIQEYKLYEKDTEILKIYNEFMDSVPISVNYIICYPDYFTIPFLHTWAVNNTSMRTHLGAFISIGSSVCLTPEQEKLLNTLIKLSNAKILQL
jgi:hypothetical protein